MLDLLLRGRRSPVICALSFVVLIGGATSNALAADYDRDGAAPPADCDDFDAAAHPGAVDRPDLRFEDTNCDGIDGDAAKAVFVDAGAGQDSRSGSREFPKKTLANAISAAKAQGKDVYVAAGTYAESVNLESAIGIYGGYTPSFGARVTSEPTTISGGQWGAIADGDTGVVLQLLTLRGGDQAAAGASSYGLRAINGATVALERVTAEGGRAGAGGVGLSGTTPGQAASGLNGSAGSCGAGTFGSGGLGGSQSAGRGGRGATAPEQIGAPGLPATGPGGGAGGAGAALGGLANAGSAGAPAAGPAAAGQGAAFTSDLA